MRWSDLVGSGFFVLFFYFTEDEFVREFINGNHYGNINIPSIKVISNLKVCDNNEKRDLKNL